MTQYGPKYLNKLGYLLRFVRYLVIERLNKDNYLNKEHNMGNKTLNDTVKSICGTLERKP